MASLAFVVIPVLLVVVLICGAAFAWRRSGAPPSAVTRVSIVTALLAAAWLAGTWALADSGVLRQWDRRPPLFGLLILSIVVIAAGLAFSPFGSRLVRNVPLWALVAVQAFRLPLELAMHAMYERGTMPVQLSYSGRNFDIVTGITAIVLAVILLTGRGGRTLVLGWNILGLGLLMNVVIVAILGTPVFRYFGDDHLNVWITYTPFVWLPAVMVLAALAGHLLIFKALRSVA